MFLEKFPYRVKFYTKAPWLDSEIKKQASPAAEGIEGLSVKKQ